MTEVTHTSCSLALSRDTLQSDALRSDRQISFVRTGTDKVGGSLDIEFGAKEFDPFLAAALGGTWTADVLKAGTVLQMFTLERVFGDIGLYQRFVGCAVNQMTLSVKPGALVTGSFDFVGLSAALETDPLSDAPVMPGTPVPFDGFTGSLKVNNAAIAVVTGIDLTLANGVEAKYPLFTRSATSVIWGKSNLSGTITAFFTEDAALLRKFIQDEKVSLEFVLQYGADSYTFLIPVVTLTGGDNAVQGEAEISLSIPWVASLDTALGTNIQITRSLA
jgi:hypothetical protein